MGRSAWAALVVSALVLFAVPAVATAQTATPARGAPSADDVVRELGLGSTPVDYVLMVDTSLSMLEEDRYGRVRSAVSSFVHALSPDDRVALLAFDGGTTVQFPSAPVGGNVDRILEQLPPSPDHGPDGQFTDIGKALNGALGELERQDSAELGAVVLVTDGRHDPPGGSLYPTTSGPSWDELAQRVKALTEARGHQVVSYALALGPDTDAGVASTVFPGTVVLNAAGGELSSYLDRLRDDVRATQVSRLVSPDLKAGVQVTWRPDEVGQLDLTDETTITVRLTSTAAHLPITVSNLAVSSSGFDMSVEDVPATVDLTPGASVDVRITLRPDSSGISGGIGARTETRPGALTLTGSVTTPWEQVLRSDFGLTPQLGLTGGETPAQAQATVGLSYLSLFLLFLLLLLIAVAVQQAVWRCRPVMDATLVVHSPGGPPRNVPLRGRRVRFGRPGRWPAVVGGRPREQSTLPGTGKVTSMLVPPGRRDASRRVVIDYRLEGRGKGRRTCGAGGSVTIAGTRFVLQADRRREASQAAARRRAVARRRGSTRRGGSKGGGSRGGGLRSGG